MKTQVKNVVVCVLFGAFFLGMFLSCLFLPRSGFSKSERRRLASGPEVSGETILSGKAMSDFETYATDNLPFRDFFRTMKATSSYFLFRRLDSVEIQIEKGYAAKLEQEIDEASLAHAVDRFRSLSETYLKDRNTRVYLSVIPDKGAFFPEKEGEQILDYDLLEKKMAENTKDFATYLPISDLLSLSDYYKTDTHWRQEKIVDVAQRLGQGMGVEIPGDYAVQALPNGFRGVYAGQSALPFPSETLYYLKSPSMDAFRVSNGEKNGAEMPLYDLERGSGYDPYEVFLSGPLSLITIENPEAGNGRHLIVFRDSFGSAIAPLLAEGYGKVTLIDIRYLSPAILDRFVDFEGADVLFLYSTLVLNHSETIK